MCVATAKILRFLVVAASVLCWMGSLAAAQTLNPTADTSDFNQDGVSDVVLYQSGTWIRPGASAQVAPPTLSPGGGSYTDSITVTIATTTAGATIRYTINGSTPDASSALYTGAITLTQDTTLRAKAYKEAMNPSAVTTATYVIEGGNACGSADVSAGLDETVSFTADTTDPDGDYLFYTFNWGEGSATDVPAVGFVPSGSMVTATHSWAQAGTYQAWVTGTDTNGATSEASDSLTVCVQ